MEHCFQLGQLNDIVRLCQRFDLKFHMDEVDWPLLTVEFNSLRGHRMDGIYEVRDNALTVFSVTDLRPVHRLAREYLRVFLRHYHYN